nr:HAMP domain-containing sensor histidine kinase [uncultured Albidiferax sp.]
MKPLGRLPFQVPFQVPFRIPFGLRFFFRTAFALLALATLALALSVLQEEKQRGLRSYQNSFQQNLAQIAQRLRHPTGQLALLNPGLGSSPDQPLYPVVLPFAAIDFDDRSKVQQAVEMAGCGVQYPDGSSLCVAVGNNPWAGGFIYLVGSYATAEPLVAHSRGDPVLDQAHRLQVAVQLPGGSNSQWLAPFETDADTGPQSASGVPTVRGRLTGFALDAQGQTGGRPVRDFRGWLWQDGRCLPADTPSTAIACRKQVFFSVRLPIDLWRDAVFTASRSASKTAPTWPPPDLDQVRVQLQMLAPGSATRVFDSLQIGATPPFTLASLVPLLQPGETLQIRQLGAGAQPARTLATLQAPAATEPAPRWLDRLVARLPVANYDIPLQASETITTSLGSFGLTLHGDLRSVNQNLARVATRMSWFVGAMLLAIALTWAAIELRIIRRITLLTKRSAAVSHSMRSADGVLALDLVDVRGHDELGVLATALAELLQRVHDDLKRERIRTAQEKDMWHAVGHEIMSPLQSLKALHGTAQDPSNRYIQRMQRAIQVLYGSASPSEAFEASLLDTERLDVNAFLTQVADNAASAGIGGVQFSPLADPLWVKADNHSLEDVVTHVLTNAQRHRTVGSPITLTLERLGHEVLVGIFNQGPPIPAELLGKIFEYGVSSQADTAALGSRGQGLFVAKTYMAKMGGTIAAQNTGDGVRLELRLQAG